MSRIYIAITVVLLVTAPSPLLSQTPDAVFCSYPDTEVFGDVSLRDYPVDVDSGYGEEFEWLQVFLSVSTDEAFRWRFWVESPEGTLVALTSGNDVSGSDSLGEDFLLIYDDAGVEATGARNSLNCGGCYYEPAGSLEGFVGESVDGEWALVASGSFGLAVLDSWCLRIFETAPLHPIDGLVGVSVEAGELDLTWTNGAEYDEVEVYVNGALSSTLDDGFVEFDEETAQIDSLPYPQRARVCLVGVSGALRTIPVCIEVPVLGQPLGESVEPSAAIASDGDDTYELVASFDEELIVGDIQVSVEVEGSPGAIEVDLEAPDGSVVRLHRGFSVGDGDRVQSTYWDSAREWFRHADCACFRKPRDPLSVLFGQVSDDGDWTVRARVVQKPFNPPEAATVELLELRLYEESAVEPVEDLACVYPVSGDYETFVLEWTNADDYDEVWVLRDGFLLEVLEGPFADEGVDSFTGDFELLQAEQYSIIGIQDSVPALPVSCTVRSPVPPVRELSCVYDRTNGELGIEWVNPIGYDEIEVLIDGEVSSTLNGKATSYGRDSVDEDAVFRVEVIPRVGEVSARESVCHVFSVEAPTIEDCRTDLEIEYADLNVIDFEVSEPFIVGEAEVILESQSSWHRSRYTLRSPDGTNVGLNHTPGGSSTEAREMAVLFSSSGDSWATSGSLRCGCVTRASGPGALDDFSGEPAPGDWQLRLTPSGGNNTETLSRVCLRLAEGCELRRPEGLTCEADPADASIELSWTNEDDYDSIEIYLEDTLVVTLGGDAESYRDAALEPGNFSYRVRAFADSCDVYSRPCQVGFGFSEYCTSEFTRVEPYFCGCYDQAEIDVSESAFVSQIELGVFVASLHTEHTVTIESPLGTRIDLTDRREPMPEFCCFDVIFSEDGRDDAERFDCNRCRVKPIIGNLSDFDAEDTEGVWTVEFDRVLTLDPNVSEAFEVCLFLYEECDTAPPSGVTCTTDDREVTLEWGNESTYGGILIRRDGELIATLENDATEYTDSDLEVGQYVYSLSGTSPETGCSNAATCVAEVGLFDACATDVAIPAASATLATVVESELEIPEEIRAEFVEVSARIETDWVLISLGLLSVVSPDGVEVVLVDAFSGGVDKLDAVFATGGAELDSLTADCACRVAPTGPGSLSDFVAVAADGDWVLSVTNYSALFDHAVEEWCVRVYEGCPVAPPESVTCTIDEADVLLDWSNFDEYDSLEIFRNDLWVTSLEGDATTFVDKGVSAGRYVYRLLGFAGDASCGNLSGTCSVSIDPFEYCNDDVDFDSGSSHEDTLEFEDDLYISELEIRLDTLQSVAGWIMAVESPDGTSVTLLNEQLGDGLQLTFSDHGELYDHWESRCECLVRPSGRGSLDDFAGEWSIGTWRLLLDLAPDPAPIDVWCVVVYEGDPPPPANFLRGDCNGNGTVLAITDALYLLQYGFIEGPVPPCLDAADVDGNNTVFPIIDALYLLDYGFNDGPAPPDPGPTECGPDPDVPSATNCLTEPAVCFDD